MVKKFLLYHIDIRESCVLFPSCSGQEIMNIVIDM